MNSRVLSHFLRRSVAPLSSPLAATACLRRRIPQSFNQPPRLLRASITTEASSSSSNTNPSPTSEPTQPPPSEDPTEPKPEPEPALPLPAPFRTPSLLKPNKTVSHKFGTVISAGRMDKVVRVEHVHQLWDKKIRRPYPQKTIFRVADPRNSLREGDVIEFTSGHRASKTVRHVVERIVAPFGVGIEERPAVMTEWERAEERIRKSRMGKKEVRLGKVKRRVMERLAAEGMLDSVDWKEGEKVAKVEEKRVMDPVDGEEGGEVGKAKQKRDGEVGGGGDVGSGG
ncbi:hypothetical protein PRK78_006108 [Emydomyces testavorans]|uniref:Nucleic acid-binding protein n=1 Tax=Emydomyces testavorans TaxID=2070801 RepID=A0AAF0DNH8_9EURO|nr:hypothetical protein PRK78_006108 [Emydomyces testavorans]